MKVIQCTEENLESLENLFNEYRIFYEQESDIPSCRAFIQKNLEQERSMIFLLLDDAGGPIGFSQLYPAICSLAMKPYYYLSDLYVVPSARKKGHARYLMNYVMDHCTKEGAQRVTLDTAIANKTAQGLYESLGYERESVYITYHRTLAAIG
jgi:ribosomal protein S18 acetylase RimI-like enzyme